MSKRRFQITGIKPPGIVDIYPYGELRLCDLPDEKLEEILEKTQCEFIVPVGDGKTKPIVVEKIGNKGKASKEE